MLYSYRALHVLQAFPEVTDGMPGHSDKPIGVIVCKQSIHKGKTRRGYIAMLSVDREWRKRGIGEPASDTFRSSETDIFLIGP
jgi:N-alpha-acetyltransferase 30